MSISTKLLVSVIFIAGLGICTGQGVFINLKSYENEWIRKLINDPLNNVQIRPTIMNTSEPIEISVSIVVRHFELIDDKKQEFSIQMTLRQEWEDDRLAYAKYSPVQLRQMKHLTFTEPDKIWTPDTFFKNEKRGSRHTLMKPNAFAKVYPNGTVRYDTRISLTFACPMNLRFFPFDTQICTLQIASYGFARDDLIYKWKPTSNPITVGNDASLPPSEFFFHSVTSNYCDAQSGTGVYSCLLAEFNFRRGRGHYLKQTYIPVTNCVIVAWLSFLLNYRTDKTFLLRGIICLYSLGMAFVKISTDAQGFPKTTYTTAMDSWTGISLTFIFFAFVEFIVVHYLSTHEFGMAKKSSNGEGSNGSRRNSEDMEMQRTKMEGSLTIEPENMEVERKKSVEVQTHWTTKLVPEKIEKWSLILYPAFFFGFNLIYLIVCANAGDN